MKFQKRKLKNGITVMHEKRDLPLVSFGIANPFAGAHETAEIKGIAHLIEHLVFTGTKTRTHEDISREIEKKGGILNAFTANDVTAYWFKLPSEHLFNGIDILVDMLKNPKFDEEKFEKEKKVVIEEIKMYHDTPQRHVMEKLEENLYESPFGMGIAGTKESVTSLKRDFVKSFFDDKYSPENYFVTVVGDADFDKVCDYLEKEFQPGNKTYQALKIKKRNMESEEERTHIDQAHFAFGVHAPMPGEKELYVLDVLDAYLANGMSSRLFLEIREKRGLAYTVRSSLDFEKNYSHYSIYVGTTKEAIPKVKELILKGFEEIEKMTEQDLKESKERLIGLKKVSSEEGINVLNGLIFSEIANGNAAEYYKFEEKINSVTLEEVKILAKKLPKKYSTATIVPK
jgi:predicted Zn-dependent peptidase